MKIKGNKRKSKASSKISIIFGFFLLILSAIGFSLGSFYSNKSYTKYSDYDISYNARYEFDPYSTEDPSVGVKQKGDVDIKDVEKKMNAISKSYSNILSSNGISNGIVYPEIYKDKDEWIKAYLNVEAPNKFIKSLDPGMTKEEQEKTAIAGSLAYYNNMLSSRYSIIYSDGYTVPKQNTTGDEFKKAKLYMWNINDMFDQDSKATLDSFGDRIDVKLGSDYTFGKKTNETYDEGSIKKTFYDAKNPKEGEINETYPFMYVIRDFRGLINRIQYLTRLGWYQQPGKPGNARARDAWWQLDDSERKFADYIWANQDKYITDECLTKYDFDTNSGFQETPYKTLNPTNNHLSSLFTDTKNNFKESMLLTFLQGEEDGKIMPGKTSTVNSEYEFLNKYLVQIVNRDNFESALPDKDPKATSIDSDGKWMVLENNNKGFSTKSVLEQLTSQKMSLPLMNVTSPTGPAEGQKGINVDENGIKEKSTNLAKINKTFQKAIFNFADPVITSIVALVLISLLIGIIVSILYRVPGFIAFICSFVPTSICSLIIFTSGFGLSIGLILGIGLSMVIGLISSLMILNRMQKYLMSHKTVDVVIKQSFSKGLFPALDLHIILLLLGISILFFPTGQLTIFAVTLIVGSILSFLSSFVLNFITNILVFNNSIGMYKPSWVLRKKLTKDGVIQKGFVNNNADRAALIANKDFRQDGYISQIKIRQSSLFNIKKWSIINTLLVFLCIASFIIIFTVGIPTAHNFYGGTRLMIMRDGTLSIADIVKLLPDSSSWHSIQTTDVFYYLESSKKYDYTSIIKALAIDNVFVQTIDPTSSLNILKNTIYSLLTFVGLISIYNLARYGWVSVLPIAFVGTISTLLLVAVVSFTQIYFDSFVAYSLFITTIMSFVFINMNVSTIFSKWVRKNPLPYVENKIIFSFQAESGYYNQLMAFAFFGIMATLNIFFLPIELWSTNVIIIFGLIISWFFVNYSLPFMLLMFTNIKNTYQIKVKKVQSHVGKRNLDKIDEELINTINVNTSDSSAI